MPKPARKSTLARTPAKGRADAPAEIAEALNQSVVDLRQDRTSDIGEFLDRMRAELDAHLQRGTKKKR
jgi:hypothetical protein